MIVEELSNNKIRVYQCKDGRYRVYDKETRKVTSYPRLIMEEKLGRKLKNNEQVHHDNEDVTDNSDVNLKISLLGEHQRHHSTKYHDMTTICDYCGISFTWTAKQQRTFYGNRGRKTRKCSGGPFCSNSCRGKHNATVSSTTK